MVAIVDCCEYLLGGFFVIGVGSTVSVQKHLHPEFSAVDQPHSERLSNSVAVAGQLRVALPTQIVSQRIPGQFIGILESMDNALFFQL